MSRPPSLTRREKIWPITNDLVSRPRSKHRGEPWKQTVFLPKGYNILFGLYVLNVVLNVLSEFKRACI
jgi:hypothetical protein